LYGWKFIATTARDVSYVLSRAFRRTFCVTAPRRKTVWRRRRRHFRSGRTAAEIRCIVRIVGPNLGCTTRRRLDVTRGPATVVRNPLIGSRRKVYKTNRGTFYVTAVTCIRGRIFSARDNRRFDISIANVLPRHYGCLYDRSSNSKLDASRDDYFYGKNYTGRKTWPPEMFPI